MAKNPNILSVNEGSAPTPNAPVQQPAEPQKTVSLSQNPKKETATFNGMTVAQKLNYLNVKDKRGILTPEERQQKEDFEKQLQEEGNEGNITPEDGTKIGDKDKEPKDLFKEEDIIQYMYNDWLLGGANWLYKQIYKQIDKAYERVKNRQRQAKADKESQKNTKYNTITTRDTINAKADKMDEGSKAAIDKNRDKVKNTLAEITAGNIDASQASGFTKILMNELPERQRQSFCSDAMGKIDNLAENIKAVKRVAGMLASAQMAETICHNQNAFKNVNAANLFEAISKRNAIIIARNMDNLQKDGGNPEKFINNLSSHVEKANKFADKQYKKLNFEEAGKKAKTNSALRKINESLGIKPEEATRPDRLEPKSMLEHLVASNNFEDLLTKQLENNKRTTNAAAIEKENNNNRRNNFEARIATIRPGYSGSRVGPQITKDSFNKDSFRLAQQFQQGASGR